jgi:sortase A
MHRALRILSVALITAGIVILVDAGLTLAWKEPVSAVYSEVQQSRAADQLAEVESEFLAVDEVVELSEGPREQSPAQIRATARKLARLFAEGIREGEGIGRIRVPAMGADYVMLEGTDPGTLQRGPGHYPDTKLPGQGGTAAIAGHRTTYGAPFNDIDAVEKGDEVVLEMPYGTFTYEVTGTEIVEPTETEIVRDVGYEQVVLTACHPLYSAAERYAVFAKLREIELSAAARNG